MTACSAVRRAQWVGRECATTVRAGLVLVLVEWLVRRRPLPDVCRALGLRFELEAISDSGEPLDIGDLPPSAQRQLRCAERVAGRWPFGQGPCLRRSLVAGHLARRAEPTLRIGVGSDGHAIVAHAWLEIDGRPLEITDDYRVFTINQGAP